MLLRGLPLLIELSLLVYCVTDCIRTPKGAQRDLPKPVWLLLIIFLPLLGSIFWLVAGRPRRESGGGYGPGSREDREPPARRPIAPDDDPEFLRGLGRLIDDDLRRRENGQEPEAH